MKTILCIIVLGLLGCASQEPNPMQGAPVTLNAPAYEKMCLRDPASVLCPQDEFFVTNSGTLNQQWCDLCAKDSSYSWCKHFPDCVVVVTQAPAEQEVAGETMQGKAVRIRAQAYEDLCERTPASVLCTNNESN
jgi:hypothetical protein